MDIKFKNQTDIQNGDLKRISKNIVELLNIEQNLSGFEVYFNNNLLGDYSEFTTLYKTLENGYQLSNDGSIYVEPELSEPTLEQIKENKIFEMNDIQQMFIKNGCDVQLSNGEKEKFTLTENDQLSLNSLSVKNLEGLSTLPWHPADENVHCKFYSEEDMKKITDTCMNFVTYHITYFRDLRIYIRSLQTKEEVDAIEYGMDIPIQYQSEVLQALLMNELGL